MSRPLLSEFSGPAPVFCHHYKLPPLFRSRYKLIVHFYYCFFFWRLLCVLLAQWPHNAPTNSILLGKHIVHWAKYTRYESETHKRQKYKWVISVVLKLRQIISKTSCTQSRESEVQTFDIWPLCLTWTKRAINGSRQSTVTKIVVNATYSSTLILSM